jgi:hypothetical protein
VDESVLALTGYELPDPVAHFYNTRQSGTSYTSTFLCFILSCMMLTAVATVVVDLLHHFCSTFFVTKKKNSYSIRRLPLSSADCVHQEVLHSPADICFQNNDE